MDNVRNITGSPVAGIDPHELVDTRPLCHGGCMLGTLWSRRRTINLAITPPRPLPLVLLHTPKHSTPAPPCPSELNAAITAHGKGNAALTNLPRKINIGISSSRDDFAHCHINDVGLKVRLCACACMPAFTGGRGGPVAVTWLWRMARTMRSC
jgi:ferredoxin-nitrite reductase